MRQSGVRPRSGQAGDSRQPRSRICRRATRSSPASSATTTPSSRSSSTPFSRGTTSSCSASAARPRAGSFAASSICSTSRSRSCRAARSTTIRCAPLCGACRARVAARATTCRSRWLPRDARYVEKLATPDVTIADMLGDIDPIKAAQAGLNLADELTMHYGLLPRANRGIFAINELPDLAGQDPGRPLQHPPGGRRPDQGLSDPAEARRAAGLHRQPRRLHGARQDHHAAQGSHRLGDPHALPGHAARRHRDHEAGSLDRPPRRRCASTSRSTCAKSSRKWRSRRAPTARSTSGPASASGCRSRRWSSSSPMPSAARSPTARTLVVPRVTDLYAALPSITGKFELEYEGELRGAEQVARDLIRSAVGRRVRRDVRRRRHAHGRRVVRPGRHRCR